MASIIQNFPLAELKKKGPALLRTVEAWYFSLSAYACSIDNGANAAQPSIWVPGKDAAKASGLLCSYAQDSSTLVLAFDGGLPLVIHSLEVHHSKQKLTTQRPFYPNPEDGVGEDAVQVVTEYNTCLSSLLSGIEPALSRLVSTGKPPLKILCTGFCMGGGLAVLAAPWAALKWPNSDISCITFGAPIIGNPGFNKSFNLLVGLSYRGIYRLDPVPDMPRSFNKLNIKLCATGDDFYFDGRGNNSRSHNPRSRPTLNLHHNLSDHSTTGYEQGISAAASSTSPGVPVTADGRAVLIDPLVAGQVPELAERGDCSCDQCPCPAVSKIGNGTSSNAVIKTDIDNLKILEKKLETSIAARNQQERKEESKLAVATSRKDGDLEKVNTEIHRTSAHIEAVPLPSCMASSSNTFFSCLSCISSPVLGERSVFTSCNGGNDSGGSGGGGLVLTGAGGGAKSDPGSVHLDQFWAEMHLQAEALRESSEEVVSYMQQVFLGKKPQPPEVVQTAMAAAVRLGQQSYGKC